MGKILTKEEVDRYGIENCGGKLKRFTSFSLSESQGYTEIGEDAFGGLTYLKQVSLPNGIRKIGARAFCDCVSLQKISLPKTVEEIGEEAFSRCKSLASFPYLKNLRIIGPHAFSYCYRLHHMAFSDKLTDIGYQAFIYTGFWKYPEIPAMALRGTYPEAIFENSPWVFRVAKRPIFATLCYLAHRRGHRSQAIIHLERR